MKVYVYPADMTGCGFYRLIWPAKVLLSEGHDVTVVMPNDQRGRFDAKMVGERMVDIAVPEDADVIVLQRVTHRYLTQAINLIKSKGIAVVVDMDDDLTCINPGNPAWQWLHPRSGGDHSWLNATTACHAATWVTVSTPALAPTYAPHGRVTVVPNYAPRWFTQIEHTDSPLIGWAGSVHSHPDDFPTASRLIADLTKMGHRFKVIGPENRIAEALGAGLASRVEATGAIEFHRWPFAVNELGVGIAPLAHTKFNAAKSWLKPLEYAALGIPSVSDGRVEYARLRRDWGIGNIARSAADWRRTALSLVTNEARRREESERDRAIINDHLTIDDNAWRWWEAWSDAEANRDPVTFQAP